MNAGTKVAGKIAKGLAKAGQKTGSGTLYATIRRSALHTPPVGGGTPIRDPWDTLPDADPAPDTTPTYFEVICLAGIKEVKDPEGGSVSITRRVLTIDALGVTPIEQDMVCVGIRKADVTVDTQFENILAVHTLAPGGVPLQHQLYLAI